jgi:diaminopimelate decarboxylase
VDSKFGFSISDGAALDAIRAVLSKRNLEFLGLHCHIGSQIFELKPFGLAVEKMTDFIKVIGAELKTSVKELNMGGGYGITYTSEDKPLAPAEYVAYIADKLKECVAAKKIAPPRLILEPGRSIVGEAGVTLYTVGAIKDIKEVKKYIAVDGGMFDNPRFALYQAKYEAVLAAKADAAPAETVTVAGKCCESGDILVEDARLPAAESGDILAVLSTGAYNYSMASNYNRHAVPPVVLVDGGKADYIVRPQTYADLANRDALPEFL